MNAAGHNYPSAPYTLSALERIRTSKKFLDAMRQPYMAHPHRRRQTGAHRPETLGRHAITVQQVRASAAIHDMWRLTQQGTA